MSPTAAKSPTRSAGFTLVEMMVGMACSLIIICAVLSTYTFLGRNLTRMTHAQQLQKSARFAMALFKQDAATATSIVSPGTSAVTFNGIPLPATVTGTYAGGTQNVTYTYASNALTRAVTQVTAAGVSGSATTTTLMNSLTSFSFAFYNAAGATTTNASFVKRAEFQFASAIGDAGAATRTVYAAASPRTSVRNKAFVQ